MSNQTQNIQSDSIKLHSANQGKLEIKAKVAINDRQDLALAYTPGVGAVCSEIAQNPHKANELTIKKHSVAVISDGSAVLGLGNIGPLAALPVMEGKAIIFKKFANLDAWPIVLDVHSTDEIVRTIKAISPGFGGINLEDIAAPQCFEIEEQLISLGIPVMHDDQHGTAVIVYAGLKNACKVLGKNFSELKVVINGAGAAGLATAKMLLDYEKTGESKVKELLLCDSKGILSKNRHDLNKYKSQILELSNLNNIEGGLADALVEADVFIGLSVAGALNQEMIKKMNKSPIIFALANPIPEIYPEEAYSAGAGIVGTGRSDFPNQINNALVFPGIFKAAIEKNHPQITAKMKYQAAEGIAKTIEPKRDQILPDLFNEKLVENIFNTIG
jgi:malate dehydrogenase (oxaloacetate-decarboxylating)